jgi:anti-sigma regulatory factor (Ser/Thr protein kinase)
MSAKFESGPTKAAEPTATTGRFSGVFELPLDPQAARLARRNVCDLLDSWHLEDELVRYDVALVTSELVTNAIRHGGDQVTMHVAIDHDTVTVAVEDRADVMPLTLHVADPLAESGRGLAIVAAVAEEWGVEPLSSGGKRVWARISPRA